MAEIAVRILGLLKDPIDSSFRFVKRQISYSFNYNSKVEKLQSETLALKNQRDILQHSVDEAQRNGEEIYENVRNWLTSAPSAIETAEGIISEKEDIMKKKCCMIGCIPDLKDRRRLSRKAEKQGFEINKLASERGTFTSISCCRTPKQITPSSVYDGEGLESRGSLLKDVINALRNPNHRVIGVYGVGGVGKTTLAKEVQRNVQLENSFDVVIFVAVSEAPDISKIQRVIADVLGLTLTEEDVEVRAEHLCKRLKDEKSKLIILDDVWIQLKWDEVGIPSGSGVNCKILLTSRRITVCQEMGARKNFSIDVLSEEEAWSLFKKTVIGDATYRELPPIANDIAKKCSGLPLLIEKVGKDLKNKPLPYWDDMLERLSYFGDEEIEKKVYSVLKRSYDNLNTEEAKSFFLLCSLFGQANVETEDLVRCSMGLGLLKGVHTITGATNRVDRLIGDLKADSLFLEGDVDSRYVKIHDVVLDTARLIAYHEKHAILEIGDFEEKENSKCTQVSLPHCSTEERLPEKLDCPKAELLILLRKGPSHSLILNSGFCIPQGFFEGNTELKVVSLSGMNLNPLSPSFSGLTNVRTLFLHYCKLGDIAMIGQLIKLEVLSFKNSYIVRVPSEIEQLTRLKLLDLRGCYIISFPANVLSKLSMLEELYTGRFSKWDLEENPSVVELGSLSRLTTLEAEIKYFKVFPILNLRKYNLTIGVKFRFESHKTTKSLFVTDMRSFHSEDGIKVLLKEAKNLMIKGDDENEGIKHIINSSECQIIAFPFLEELCLNGLKRMQTICDCQLPQKSFNNLRILNVRLCNSLTDIFPISNTRCLPQLRVLNVRNCKNVEYILSGEIADNNEIEMIMQFPQLDSLTLEHLPNLKRFYQRQINDTSFSLLDEQVLFIKLTTLKLGGCQKLKHLFTISFLKSIKQLKSLQVNDCRLMEVIILPNESAQGDNSMIFPELQTLSFRNLPKLKRFCTGYLIDFQSLTALRISKCDEFMSFATNDSLQVHSTSKSPLLFNEMMCPNLEKVELDGNYLTLMAKGQLPLNRLSKLKIVALNGLNEDGGLLFNGFKNLEKLVVLSGGSIRVLFSHEIKQPLQIKHFELSYLDSLEHIWAQNSPFEPASLSYCFQNLSKLFVHQCGKLLSFATASMAVAMMNLTEMKVSVCEMMTEVVGKDANDDGHRDEITFKKLKSLYLSDLDNLKNFCSSGQPLHFPSLEQLTICGCYKMNVFCEGSLRTPMLRRIEYERQEVGINGDLKSTIENLERSEKLRIKRKLRTAQAVSVAASDFIRKEEIEEQNWNSVLFLA